jgi:hypothetical protein
MMELLSSHPYRKKVCTKIESINTSPTDVYSYGFGFDWIGNPV